MESLKSKKIGIFSDIHIGYGQDSSMWHDNILTFGKWASKHFKNLNITEIVIPGDIFHNRSDISVKTLDIAKQFFDLFKNFRLIISTGNHCCYFKDSSKINSISLLKEWENITIIDDEPVVFKTTTGKIISVVPWGTTIENFPKADICFAHLDIKSFYQNNYHLCEKGFESSDLFKKAKYIISGHFHKKDYREYNNGKILYVGSPYQMNFGECGDDRGIYIFDLEKESFDFIKNTISPVHIKIKVSDIISKKYKAEELKKIVPNNIICLIIDHNITPDVHSVLVSKINKYEPKHLRIEYELPNSEIIVSVDEKDFEINDITKSLGDYVEAMDTPNKTELKDYLISIYDSLK